MTARSAILRDREGGRAGRGAALDIETVAVGGGSICRFDGQKLVVGPQSAGANPGPACYGRGGPLTVTDANLSWDGFWQRLPFPLDKSAASDG